MDGVRPMSPQWNASSGCSRGRAERPHRTRATVLTQPFMPTGSVNAPLLLEPLYLDVGLRNRIAIGGAYATQTVACRRAYGCHSCYSGRSKRRRVRISPSWLVRPSLRLVPPSPSPLPLLVALGSPPLPVLVLNGTALGRSGSFPGGPSKLPLIVLIALHRVGWGCW